MATTEDDPIFVASEDENDDYDDVVVIKEDPPVVDNDVIFVSETKVESKEVTSALPGGSLVDPVTVDSSCDINSSSANTVVPLPGSPAAYDADLNKALEDMIGNGLVPGISSCLSYCCYGDQDNQKSTDHVSVSGTNQVDTVASPDKSADILHSSNSSGNILCSHLDNAISITSLSDTGASTVLTQADNSLNNSPQISAGISGSSLHLAGTSDTLLLTTQHNANVVTLPTSLDHSLVVPVPGTCSNNPLLDTFVVTGGAGSVTMAPGSSGSVLLVSDTSQSQLNYSTNNNTTSDNFQQCVDLLMQFKCQYKCSSDSQKDATDSSTLTATCQQQSGVDNSNNKVPSNQTLSVCTIQSNLGVGVQSKDITILDTTSQSSSSINQLHVNSTSDLTNDDKLLSSIIAEILSPVPDTQITPVLSRSSDLSQDSLPPRKRYRFSGCNSSPATGFGNSEPEKDFSKAMPTICIKCGKTNLKIVIYCVKGHSFCDNCVEELAKRILLDKTKSMVCLEEICRSSFTIGELKKSLPEMVIDMLEKREIESIGELLASSVNDRPKFTNNNERNPDVPDHWTPLDERSTLKVVELDNDSKEFLDVAIKFFESMDDCKYYIHRISRVQNLTLWKYYTLKKIEMVHENDGLEVNEERLFHGTRTHCVEAISRKGFDWRVCGKHGVLYGEGSYFARNARYSHDYTDHHTFKNQKRAKHRMRLINKSQWSTPPAHNQSPYFPSPNMNPNLAHQNIPPPAHQQFSTSNFQHTMNQFMYPYFNTVPNLTLNTISQSSTASNVLIPNFSNPIPTQPPMPIRSNSAPEASSGTDPENLLKMFLSRVLVGKSTGGQKGFRKPPPLYENDAMGSCYDSCVDNIHNPKIWVIFDSHQSYPEYLIEYTSSDLM